MTKELLVLNRVKDKIRSDQARLDDNLAWLSAEMHRYFFRFNTDDADALTLLATNLHRMDEFQRINLVNRKERSMIAQLGETGSLYRALGGLREKNISYGEITRGAAFRLSAQGGPGNRPEYWRRCPGNYYRCVIGDNAAPLSGVQPE